MIETGEDLARALDLFAANADWTGEEEDGPDWAKKTRPEPAPTMCMSHASAEDVLRRPPRKKETLDDVLRHTEALVHKYSTQPRG